MNSETLAKRLIDHLAANSLTLATAESCTGGLIAKLLTDIPGASDVFVGGIVAYSNALKEKWLGVQSTTLESEGAVSQKTVEQMVQGLLDSSEADIGISISGIAGPGGGTAEKPVGTVYIAAKFKNKILTRHCIFKGGRKSIRKQSAEKALALVYELVKSS